jgi:predicted kinase
MIVIVLGLPGSGKSYFASRLAKRINADYINSDRVRKKMFPDRTYSEQEKQSVYDEMLESMQRVIRQNKNLVLDATFYKAEIRKPFIDELAKGDGIRLIEIVADEALIKERLKQKRPDSDADFEIYKHLKQEWDPLQEKHLILTSTENNIEDMLQKAIEYLK